ncbi:MAG: hypothetical protein J6R99_02675 [Alphaproteobacteria bacterium]|nr:hypothetical protein [Alphaproteobacteria bacterium]MBO7066589.1 hypothetical protein [Alphaproteobacteria bacterium]
MANEQNLVPFNQLSETEHRELARRGGLKSVETRRRQKTIREMAQAILNMEISPQQAGMKLGALSAEQINNIGMAILAVHANKAMEGDVASARLLMDAAEKGKENNTAAAGVQIIMAKGDEKL